MNRKAVFPIKRWQNKLAARHVKGGERRARLDLRPEMGHVEVDELKTWPVGMSSPLHRVYVAAKFLGASLITTRARRQAFENRANHNG